MERSIHKRISMHRVVVECIASANASKKNIRDNKMHTFMNKKF